MVTYAQCEIVLRMEVTFLQSAMVASCSFPISQSRRLAEVAPPGDAAVPEKRLVMELLPLLYREEIGQLNVILRACSVVHDYVRLHHHRRHNL